MPSSTFELDLKKRDVLLGDRGVVYDFDAGNSYLRRVIPNLCAMCASHAMHIDAAVVWFLAKLLLECESLRFLMRRVMFVSSKSIVTWRLLREDELTAQLLHHIQDYRNKVKGQSSVPLHPHGTRRASQFNRNPALSDSDVARGIYMNFDVLLEVSPTGGRDVYTNGLKVSDSTMVQPLRLAFVNDPLHFGNARFLEIVQSCGKMYHRQSDHEDEVEFEMHQELVFWAVTHKLRNGANDVRFLVYNPRPVEPSDRKWRVATDFEEEVTITKYLDDAASDPGEFDRMIQNKHPIPPAAVVKARRLSSLSASSSLARIKHESNYAAGPMTPAAMAQYPPIPNHRLVVKPQKQKASLPHSRAPAPTLAQQQQFPLHPPTVLTPKTAKPSRSTALQRAAQPAGSTDGGRYITNITKYDVIFGRGKPLARFSGNVRMRDIVEVKKVIYAASHKSIKSHIIKETMDEIMASPDPNIPVRFLKPVRDGVYEVASKQEAHSKISHRLREAPSVAKTRKRHGVDSPNLSLAAAAAAAAPSAVKRSTSTATSHQTARKKTKTSKSAKKATVSGHQVTTVEPDEQHIVFGREKFLQERIGNIRFRELVSKYAQSYRDASNSEAAREDIVSSVIKTVRDGGRINAYHFMELGGKCSWVMANDEAMTERVVNILSGEQTDSVEYSDEDTEDENEPIPPAGPLPQRPNRGLRDHFKNSDDDEEKEGGIGSLSALASISSRFYLGNGKSTSSSSSKRSQEEPDGGKKEAGQAKAKCKEEEKDESTPAQAAAAAAAAAQAAAPSEDSKTEAKSKVETEAEPGESSKGETNGDDLAKESVKRSPVDP